MVTSVDETPLFLQAISKMLEVPGASATVLEARVPYATQATQELLGQKVASFCSQETAVLLAKRAYERAAELTSPGTPILGLSCTAALSTVRPACPSTSRVSTPCVSHTFPRVQLGVTPLFCRGLHESLWRMACRSPFLSMTAESICRLMFKSRLESQQQRDGHFFPRCRAEKPLELVIPQYCLHSMANTTCRQCSIWPHVAGGIHSALPTASNCALDSPEPPTDTPTPAQCSLHKPLKREHGQWPLAFGHCSHVSGHISCHWTQSNLRFSRSDRSINPQVYHPVKPKETPVCTTITSSYVSTNMTIARLRAQPGVPAATTDTCCKTDSNIPVACVSNQSCPTFSAMQSAVG